MASQPSPPLKLPDNFSPDDVDVLTELATILSRLQPPQSTTTLSGAPGSTAPLGAVTGTTPLPAAASAAAAGPDASLHLKEFPAATDHLKHKLQRARAAVKALPGMDRSIAEQEAEMCELEDKVRRQQSVLAQLRSTGLLFAREQGERMET